MRKKRGDTGPAPIEPARPVREYRRAWAALVKKLWLEDPLVCEKCGAHMKIIAFVEDRPVIEKILRHLGLWHDRPPDPPARTPPQVEVVRFDEDGVCLDQTQLL